MDIQVKYAETEDELQVIFRLNHEIYNQEMHLESPSVDPQNGVIVSMDVYQS